MELMTYPEMAKALGVPRGTLARKISIYNRKPGANPITPDHVEDCGHFKIYRFNQASFQKVKALVEAPGRTRGRHPKPKGENP